MPTDHPVKGSRCTEHPRTLCSTQRSIEGMWMCVLDEVCVLPTESVLAWTLVSSSLFLSWTTRTFGFSVCDQDLFVNNVLCWNPWRSCWSDLYPPVHFLLFVALYRKLDSLLIIIIKSARFLFCCPICLWKMFVVVVHYFFLFFFFVKFHQN